VEMSLSLQMSIKRNVLYVRLRGELDQASVERLKYRVTEVINKYYIVHIVINLKEVPFMDSSGIGFIIGRYSQLKERKGKVVVCSMNELIERIFTLSGLKKICLVATSEDEAQNILEVA
jgi:stage II sporulation protein AA (anti-sigma F factor antagonist)